MNIKIRIEHIEPINCHKNNTSSWTPPFGVPNGWVPGCHLIINPLRFFHNTHWRVLVEENMMMYDPNKPWDWYISLRESHKKSTIHVGKYTNRPMGWYGWWWIYFAKQSPCCYLLFPTQWFFWFNLFMTPKTQASFSRFQGLQKCHKGEYVPVKNIKNLGRNIYIYT